MRTSVEYGHDAEDDNDNESEHVQDAHAHEHLRDANTRFPDTRARTTGSHMRPEDPCKSASEGCAGEQETRASVRNNGIV